MRISPLTRSIISFALTLIILGSAFFLAATRLPLWALIAIATVGGLLLGYANGAYALQRYREYAELRRAMTWTAVTWIILSGLFLLNIRTETATNQRTALYFVTALGIASVLTLAMQLTRLRRLRQEPPADDTVV
ncbi:MAG TPA: hypothetical protein VGM23_02760 [Armatimonadota bacterium]|jgi:membrane-bound ClpP family serine protease